jgi:hypothetical protein
VAAGKAVDFHFFFLLSVPDFKDAFARPKTGLCLNISSLAGMIAATPVVQRSKKRIFLGFNLFKTFLDIPHSMEGALPFFVFSGFLHLENSNPHVSPVRLIGDIGLSRYGPYILQASNGSSLMSHGRPYLSLFSLILLFEPWLPFAGRRSS